MARVYEWDDYFIPGTTTLANYASIANPIELHYFEHIQSSLRQAELETGRVTIDQTFGQDHILAIHAHLLGDVYEWSGQVRTVNMSKRRPPEVWEHPDIEEYELFAPHDQILHALDEIGEQVNTTHWDALSSYEVAEQLAGIHTAVNITHPFREGNGRCTRVYLQDVARHAGHTLATPDTGTGPYINAVVAANRGNLNSLTNLLHSKLTPLEGERSPTAATAHTRLELLLKDQQQTPLATAPYRHTTLQPYGPTL